MNSVNISVTAALFQGRVVPKAGKVVGYAALITYYDLAMPYPFVFSVIGNTSKKEELEGWQIFPVIYQPEESLYKQIQFALKHEGINLLFFKKLFEKITVQTIIDWIEKEPSSIYTRKIWFLYEFLTQTTLEINNADTKIKFTTLIDENQQFAITNGLKSSRHRIINNLPGTVDFCPLIYKTSKIKAYLQQDLSKKNKLQLSRIHQDILHRTSAFLLLKDSKASFSIEGETPLPSRASRWGNVIGEAGRNTLSKEELERLQRIVIESNKFLKYGYRQQGGFVGEHDRETHQPLPDHISAKYQDIDLLMNGIFQSENLLTAEQYHPVLAAATIAFGFVFIHPFVDGNGRLHRYLIHHVLAKNNFTPQGIIFPISASILSHIIDYRKVLEKYSHGILPFIDWYITADYNVNVRNETLAFYQYYDATAQAEFLFDCIKDTIENIIPQEVRHLQKYDKFKNYMDNTFEMPDKMVALIVKLLSQNEGILSKKKRESEFKDLTEDDVKMIELTYKNIFE